MTMYEIFKWYEGTGQQAGAKSIMLACTKKAVNAAKNLQLQNVNTYLEKLSTAFQMYVCCIDDANARQTFDTRDRITKLVWDVYFKYHRLYTHHNKVDAI